MSFLSLEAGKPIKGVHVNEFKFQGVTCLDQLEDYGLSRPSRLEKSKTKDRERDPILERAFSVRGSVQRRFDKDRLARAEIYARYIESVEIAGKPGGTPAITLFLPKAKATPDDALVVPYSSVLVAIDGETQTEARYMLRDDPEYDGKESGTHPIAVTIYHDVNDEFAQQILHDYNCYANPVTEAKLAGLNSEGPLTKATLKVFEAAGIPMEDVNRFGKVPHKTQTLAQLQVMYALIGYTMKDNALTKDGNSWLNGLNAAANKADVNGDSVPVIAKLTKSASVSLEARKAPLAVWQVAGVLASRGRDPVKFKWSSGRNAIKGIRNTKEKLQRIAASL